MHLGRKHQGLSRECQHNTTPRQLMNTRTLTHAHTYTRTCTHTHAHTHANTHTHGNTHTYTRTHTHAHARTNKHTHAHTHTHTLYNSSPVHRSAPAVTFDRDVFDGQPFGSLSVLCGARAESGSYGTSDEKKKNRRDSSETRRRLDITHCAARFHNEKTRGCGAGDTSDAVMGCVGSLTPRQNEGKNMGEHELFVLGVLGRLPRQRRQQLKEGGGKQANYLYLSLRRLRGAQQNYSGGV